MMVERVARQKYHLKPGNLTPIGHGEAHKIAVEGYHLRQVGHRKTEMAEHQIGFAVVTHDRTPVLLCCCGSRSTESMVQLAELLDPEANGFARLKPKPTAPPYPGRWRTEARRVGTEAGNNGRNR